MFMFCLYILDFGCKPLISSGPRKKNSLLSIESWLFHRDPYNGLSKSPYNCVVVYPLHNPREWDFQANVADAMCCRNQNSPIGK